MMLTKIIGTLSSLTHIPKYSLIAHKFYFGQGGEMKLDLQKRLYSISIQTVWEDYCQLEINGLTGVENFTLSQQNGVAYFKDNELKDVPNEQIDVLLKIPEDYTLDGKIRGTLEHKDGQVGRTLRSKPFQIEIIGPNQKMILGDVKSQNVKVYNSDGYTSFSSLTVQQANIQSKIFQSNKFMLSTTTKINAETINIKSLIMFANCQSFIKCQHLHLESVSGKSHITAETVRIDRYYGGPNSIEISCKSVTQKISIETGTGKLQFPTEIQAQQNYEKVKLGKMHKGTLSLSSRNILIT